MKKKLLFLSLFLCCVFSISAQEVTEIWTNYNGFWNSSEANVNPIKPDNSHELLAYRYNGTIYSTGVDDAKLTNDGLTFTSLTMRALPVASLPVPNVSPNFIGLGQLYDGINAGVDSGPTNPFNAGISSAETASFLTDGIQGLDLGTNVTNIPGGTTARFNLSSAGITSSLVGDGIPDILVSQTAQPNSNTDELEFIDGAGNTVGNIVSLDITQEPDVGTWTVDFYTSSSNQTQNNFINTDRPMHFFAVDFSDFGITTGTGGNIGDAVALLYRPNGNSDPSFIAFNEPSLGVASVLTVIQEPANQNCDGTLPLEIEVQLEDEASPNNFPVAQAGLTITAELESGPGDLIGTLTQTTDGTGVATFDDLSFSVAGSHVIKFTSPGLDPGFTSIIADATGCNTIQWTGATSTQWNDATNWDPQQVPNGNNVVNILNNYNGNPVPVFPILTADAGAGDLTMESNASIILDGNLFALNGSLNITSGASIDASAPGSTLYMSSSISSQNIPANFVNTDVSNFIVENPNGVTLNSEMNITEILTVEEGTLTSNNHITMVCSFTPERQTAQIDRLVGNITGNVTVEQCFPGRRAFRLVSPSTTGGSIHDQWQENPGAYTDDLVPGYGTHITGLGEIPTSGHTVTPAGGDQFQGLDWQPSGNPSMFTFSNDNLQSWNNVENTLATNLTTGNPFLLMIRGSRDVDLTDNTSSTSDTRLRSTGVIEKGDITTSYNSIDSGDFVLVGNPFHAIVDMINVTSGNTDFTNFIYAFDPTLGGASDVNTSSTSLGGRGAYVTVSLLNPDAVGGLSEMRQFLQPYQAVFMEAMVTSPSITFSESDKFVNENQVDVFESPSDYLSLTLYDKDSFTNNNTADDGLTILFGPNGNNAVDDNDAPKFINPDENLARKNNANLLSFESRDMPQVGEILQLFSSQYRDSDYVFVFKLIGLAELNVYLFDNYTNTESLLNNDGSTAVHFNVDEFIPESTATERFEIRFQSSTLGTDKFDLQGLSVYPNPTTDVININFGENIGRFDTVELYDIGGRLVGKQPLNNQLQETQLDVTTFSSGVYLLKVSSEREQFTTKVILD